MENICEVYPAPLGEVLHLGIGTDRNAKTHGLIATSPAVHRLSRLPLWFLPISERRRQAFGDPPHLVARLSTLLHLPRCRREMAGELFVGGGRSVNHSFGG